MKKFSKTVLLAAALMVSAAAFAVENNASGEPSGEMSGAAPADNQTTILEKIEQTNSSLKTLQAHFDQTKTIPANGREISYEGTLYFTSPSQMSMDYSKPESEAFIINGTSLYMVRDGRQGLYDTTKNNMMRSLSNTLCSCIMGKINDLAKANDAEITAGLTGDGYLVSLTARVKGTRGYSNIYLVYDKTTYVLVKMKLVEFSGISNLYEMSSISRNTAVDSAVYTIPQ